MARPKGSVDIRADKCKGCLLCVESCPQKVLKPGPALNRLGYHPVEFVADGRCTGCGLCYYACPEPDAIAVTPGTDPPIREIVARHDDCKQPDPTVTIEMLDRKAF